MRVTIIAPGSRGDIQPYLALGVGLERAGHAARIVTTMDHDAIVRSYGLDLASVPLDVQAALQAKSASASLEGGGVVMAFREFARIAERGARLVAEIGLEASRGADVIVSGFGGVFLAEAIAKRLGIPLVQAYNVPLTPTAAFAGPLVPDLDFGPRSRRFGHELSRLAVWTTARMSGNRARMEVLGAPSAPHTVPRRHSGLVEGPVLYGYSSAFLPRGPEWGADVEVTGFWFTDDPPDFSPPPALLEFLAAGPPPVCIGFGSMSQRDPEATTALVLEAVRQSGARAVLLAGWGRLGAQRLPGGVFALESIPHSWLYPRCAAVVHHGGAGTTAAALRAGVPAVVVPFHGDQPFWARRAHAAGVGPAPIPRRRLTARALAAALRDATEDPRLAARAAALGAEVRAENGVGRAVATLARLRR
jgi:sterol 3beta-glucosyltransferase